MARKTKPTEDGLPPPIPTLSAKELERVFARVSEEGWTQLCVVGPDDYWVRQCDDELVEYLEDSCHTRIQRACVIRTSVEDEVVALPRRPCWVGLRVLTLASCGLDGKGATLLAGLTSLTSLNLESNRIGDEGATHLAGLTSLTSLNLDSNGIGYEGAMHLAELTKLTSLDLAYNEIGADGVAHLAALTALTSLTLWDNEIGDAGAAHLAGLTKLTSLDLADNEIGDEGAAHLARLTKLNSLRLSGNEIGDEGAAHLARLTKLTSLDLSGNKIGDEGAVHLSGLANLRSLDLSSTWIEDEGLQRLAEGLQSSGRLRHLFLQNNNITRVDAATLETNDARQIFDAVLRGRALRMARVMFLGHGGVGKSAIARRCFLDEITPKNAPHDETHNIELIRPEECRWKPKLVVGNGSEAVETRVWDFAGQLVTHGVHEAFLKTDGRTVYVAMLAADRHPEGPGGASFDAVENSTAAGNHCHYWFRTIRHFAGSTPPVVVAITRCDKATREPRPVDGALSGPDGFAGRTLATLTPAELSTAHDVAVTGVVDGLSATEEKRSVEPLREAIERAVGQLSAVREARVQPELPELMRLVEEKLPGRPSMTVEEFRGLCEVAKIEEVETAWKGFVTTLHYLGTVVYLGAREEHERRRSEDPDVYEAPVEHPYASLDGIVFNPRWFKWCVYEATRESARTDGTAQNGSPRHGWFGAEDLRQVFAGALVEYAREEGVPLAALGTMREEDSATLREALAKIGLCWYDAGRREWLFPRGLPEGAHSSTEDWPKSEVVAAFLPEGAFLRLVVEMHKSGLVVQDKRGRFQHGRDWVQIHARRMAECEGVIVHLRDQDRVEVRFRPVKEEGAAVRAARRGMLAKVVETLEERGIQVVNKPEVPGEAENANDAEPHSTWLPRLDGEEGRLADTNHLDAESKDRLLVGDVTAIVALAGQIGREQPVSDHGIDMHLEFKFENREASHKVVYLQLKSGDSYLRERTSDGAEIFNIKKMRHVQYWMNAPVPVYLVIRSSTGEIRWMEIRDWLRRETENGKKPIKQIRFEGERFDVEAVRRVRDRMLGLSGDPPRA